MASQSGNMHEAKTHLSRLVDEADAAFVICIDQDQPRSDEAAPVRSRLGMLRGQLSA